MGVERFCIAPGCSVDRLPGKKYCGAHLDRERAGLQCQASLCGNQPQPGSQFCWRHTAPANVPRSTNAGAAPRLCTATLTDSTIACGALTGRADRELCDIHERQRNRETEAKLKEKSPMAKQKQLPTLTDEKDEALTTAAVNYAKANKRFSSARVDLQQKKIILFDLMKSKGKTIYRDPEEDIVAEIVAGEDKLVVEAISKDEAKEKPASDDQIA